MTKDEAIARLVGYVEDLSESLLNATDGDEDPYTLEEHQEAVDLCKEAEALLK